MATYHNPKPKEGINTSDEHPLKEFSQLLIGVGALVLVLILVINAFAGTIAKQLPFEFEQRMVANIELFKNSDTAKQARLQQLADELMPLMDLPAGMTIHVSYNDGETVNAFATLGGNLVFFEGLLSRIGSEQELAAVMAHEIAHIRYRHPITALGKGVMLGSLAAFASGASGSAAGDWLIGSTTNLTLMKFSRDQERAADLAAAEALQARYGHIQGLQELFNRFAELEKEYALTEQKSQVVELFRSHPYSEDRWEILKEHAAKAGWQTQGELSEFVW